MSFRAADPCNGHGVCLEPLNPQCFCNQQYTGLRCERCSAGHENYPACTEVPWREKFLFEYVSLQRSVAQFRNRFRVRFADAMPIARLGNSVSRQLVWTFWSLKLPPHDITSHRNRYYPIQNFETAAQIAAGARVNDSPDNTFRALRIHNDTHDMVYAEVRDVCCSAGSLMFSVS